MNENNNHYDEAIEQQAALLRDQMNQSVEQETTYQSHIRDTEPMTDNTTYMHAQQQAQHEQAQYQQQVAYHSPRYQQEQPSRFSNDPRAQQAYQAWQSQERTPKHQKPRKPFPRKVLYGIGGIAIAAALFCGGLFAGGAFRSEASLIPDATNDTSVATTLDPNRPQMEIASTPTTSTTTKVDGALSGEAIYAKNTNSVVSVQGMDMASGAGSTGSGVVMSAEGYVITNAHVILNESSLQPYSKINVILADGTSLSAAPVGYDQTTDLAVLKVATDTALEPAEFGDSDALTPGAACYAIGSPGGVQLANTITGGTISALNRDITIDDRVMTLVQIDASINPGNSGGALINQYGQVVGITSAKLGIGEMEGLGFAIPINDAKEVVDNLIQFGYVPGRPQVGLTGYDLDTATAKAYDVPQGVLVDSVDSRSNAAAAGLQSNDIIIACNGTAITTMNEINDIKEDLKAGTEITFVVYRVGEDRELTITFALNDAYDLEGTDPAVQQQVQQQPQQQTPSNGGEYYFNPFDFFY